jgi:formate dehydrogenase maturation protein FdhE
MTVGYYKCSKCGKSKTKKGFYFAKSGRNKGYIVQPCKKCNNKLSKIKYQSVLNKERYKGYHLKSKYHIDLDRHKKMYAGQNGKCLVCGCPTDYDKIVVDHDHKTGKIRGLLCAFCNTLTGYAESHPERIEQVKRYLGVY